MNKTTIGAGIIGLVVLAGGVYWYVQSHKEVAIATATFGCDAGKTIAATFYKSSATIVLSDGRSLSLPHALSADGARYANKDESIVFWNRGNTAFITEGTPAVQTYSNCLAPDASGKYIDTYASSTAGISLQYERGYTVNESYAYDQFGPKKLIHGVSFTIPSTMATGTNLASDSYVSVEWLPRAKLCTGDIYLQANVKAHTVTEGGVEYSVASSTGAGAGNRYEETVYALPNSHPCTAVRYFVHYGVIENYPPGAVAEFNHDTLFGAFDTIRNSLVLSR